jgi:hypothetical protein
MTIDEKDNMIEQLMVDGNAAMAATAASSHSDKGMVMECEVSNKDFVLSSR